MVQLQAMKLFASWDPPHLFQSHKWYNYKNQETRQKSFTNDVSIPQMVQLQGHKKRATVLPVPSFNPTNGTITRRANCSEQFQPPCFNPTNGTITRAQPTDIRPIHSRVSIPQMVQLQVLNDFARKSLHL